MKILKARLYDLKMKEQEKKMEGFVGRQKRYCMGKSDTVLYPSAVQDYKRSQDRY